MRQKKFSISSFPIISLWELKVAIATRVLIRLEQKTQLFVPPTCRCYMWNMRRIGPAPSEKKSFENVEDGRRTDDEYLYIYLKLTYEPSAQVS